MMLPHPDGTGTFIQVRPDLRLHVVSAGDPQGQPIILLHGYPEFWWSWRYQLRFLAEQGFYVIAPDFRGVNYSDKPKPGYDPETLATDIIGLLDSLHIQKAVVVGHDYGGFIAYTLALLFPTRVEKIVAIGALHPARWADIGRRGSKKMRLAAIITDLGHRLFSPAIAAANETLGIGRMMLWMAHNKGAFPFNVRATHSRAYHRGALTATMYIPHTARWFRDRLPENLNIHHPVLVLWSGNDFAAPVWVTRTVTESMPQAQVVIVPNTGHWAQQENPDFVNAALLEFLTQLPSEESKTPNP